jgi:phosphatidylglycerol:prolipoprotein diacylglycerol transferase
MADPLIPYLTFPELRLTFLEWIPGLGRLIDAHDPPSIKPFGLLVAIGVYVGALVGVRHARSRGLDAKKMSDFIFWTVGYGFVGGHVLDAIFYHPHEVARNPLYLFALWNGLSSFGGFVGAMVGGFAWGRHRRESILPYVDVICSVFPLAWVFGRAGCSVVHDHPGRLSSAWFAVRYPLLPEHMGRFDLGLYECLLTIPLAIVFALLWRRGPRAAGFYVGWLCLAYAPIRFLLDFLREREGHGVVGADPRYAGLTPAQWACFALLGVGLYFVMHRGHTDAGPTAAASGGERRVRG